MFQILRGKCPTTLSQLTLSALALSVAFTSQAIAAGKTIAAVMHSDPRIIDSVFTTAFITRDRGYMLYDTLLATDANFKI
jgi:peptide/nickel transport system substrate-binding protein